MLPSYQSRVITLDTCENAMFEKTSCFRKDKRSCRKYVPCNCYIKSSLFARELNDIGVSA